MTFAFDARTVQPDAGRGDPVPAGWYVMAAEKYEMKPTSAGTGTMLAFVFTILEGQYQNRKVFFNFNVQNPNAQTVEIAYKQLSAFYHATGHLAAQDPSEQIGRPFRARVKIRAASGDYEAANDITAFKHMSEQVGAAPAAAPGTFAPPQYAPPPAAAPSGPPPGWQPPAAPPSYAPPQAMPPAAPPQWQPPQQPQQPQYQQPQQPPAAAPAPQWQPPQGAPTQYQPQAPAMPPAAPAQPPAMPSAAPAMPPAWQPPAPPPGAATPPWQQQPPQQ